MSAKMKRDHTALLMAPVMAAGAAVLGWAIWRLGTGWQQELSIAWLVLAAATVVVGSYSVPIPGTVGIVSISDTFNFSALLLFGLPQAVITAALDGLVATRRKTKRLSSILFSAATMSISVYLAGRIFSAALSELMGTTLAEANLAAMFPPLLLLALTHYLIDSLLVAAAVGLRSRKPILSVWRNEFLWTSISCFSSASAAGMSFLLIRNFGFSAIGIITPVLAITYFSYKIYIEKVEEKNHHIREIAKVHLSTIECLATAIDAKDQITHGHIRRVQVYTMELAKLLKVSELEMEGLRAAALLHDIGKLAVPEYILNKPAKLTPKEFEKIKIHTLVGADILSAVEFPYPVIPGVLHHHERWDGKGYPSGLKDTEIPLPARILCLADFYDALTTDRPYRKAMDKEQVLQIIREESGKIFDPRLAHLFCVHIDGFEDAVKAVEKGQRRLIRLAAGDTPGQPEISAARPQQAVLNQIASANREVLVFYEIARHLGRSLEIGDVLDIVGNKLERLVSFTDLVIYLCDSKTDTLVASHVSGPHKEIFDGYSIPRGHGVSGWALANRRSLSNANPALDFDHDKLERVEVFKSLSVFPLFREQDNLGCISFYSIEMNSFTEDHARIMEVVSQQISESVFNALVYEQTREDSLTDPLTGLPNSRYLYIFLEQELARARRQGHSLSLLVLDLDGFKGINDNFGHQAGDQALREIGTLLRRTLRDSDTVIRYAGDEFIVVLPHTGLLEAQVLMSRLQDTLDQTEIDLNGAARLRAGLSAGCSCYPEEGNTMEDLIVRADRRMYDNKRFRQQEIMPASRSGKQCELEPDELAGIPKHAVLM